MSNFLFALTLKQQYGLGFFLVIGIVAVLIACILPLFGIYSLINGKIKITKNKEIAGIKSRLISILFIVIGIAIFYIGLND